MRPARPIIDSSAFVERECPRPTWTRNSTREDWLKAYDIAQRYLTMPYRDALAEFHLLPIELYGPVRTRWAALRGLPIDWIVWET